MAGVLTNGKGFYHSLVYVLECHRLGLKLLPPSVNEPGPSFVPQGKFIRVPLTRMKGLTQKTTERLLSARDEGRFNSMTDFFQRSGPGGEELEGMNPILWKAESSSIPRQLITNFISRPVHLLGQLLPQSKPLP